MSILIYKYYAPCFYKWAQYFCWTHPNWISITNVVTLYFIMEAFFTRQKYIMLLFIVINCLIDEFDGPVARVCKKTSKFGAFLDMSLDFARFVSYLYCFITIYPNIIIINNEKHKVIFCTVVMALIWFVGFKLFHISMDTHKSEHKTRQKFYELLYYNYVPLNILCWYTFGRKM